VSANRGFDGVHRLGPGRAGRACCLVLLAVAGIHSAGCTASRHAAPPTGAGVAAGPAGQKVNVWTERISLPTYPIRPDPVPRFQATDDVKYYPYPSQADIGSQAKPKTWTAVCMENRYLKIVILPELGGRVFAMYDKLAGTDVIYRQKSIKPGRVGIRGAWTSGGIEYNFPDSHSVTTLDKVHWTTRQDPDGSAAVLIGDVERISRMAWTVELRLAPDRACMQDRIFLHNRTPVRQRYYYWTNAGVEATDQTQLIFPFPKIAGHFGGGLEDWPVRDGTDWSWYRLYKDSTTIFGIGGSEDFVGAYDHGRGAGVAYYADRVKMPGRKFWSWGTSPAGMRWAQILSDDGRPYLELQAGPMLTQSEFAWMQPYETQRFDEYWIPVSRIGPFARANPQAVVRLTVQEGEATVGVLPLQRFPAAKVELSAAGRVVQTWKTDLSPEKPLLATVKVGAADAASLHLVVRDARGGTIIEHTCGKYALEGPLPSEIPNMSEARVDASTPAGAARQYELQWLNCHYTEAAKTIEEALTRWPADPALCFDGALFRLYQGRPGQAIDLLQPLSGRKDGLGVQAKYYLALADLRSGDPHAALGMLADVQKTGAEADDVATWARAATILRAKALMSIGKFGEAHAELEPLLQSDPRYAYAAALSACAARRAGRRQAALRIVRDYLSGPDLEPMARLEVQLVTGRGDPTLHRMLLRDPEVAIELASDYISVADWRTAEAVLTGSCGQTAKSGMTWLMAGWCAEVLGMSAQAVAWRARGEGAPIDFVLPSRLEELAAADNALQMASWAPRAAYYKGLVLMRLMRYDEALTCWRQAIDARDDNALARRCLAMALASLKQDRQGAVAHLIRAIRIEPHLPAFYLDLAGLYRGLGRQADARDVLVRAMRNVPVTDSLVTDLATAYLAEGQYLEAVQALVGHRFNATEGRYGAHDDYAAAWLGVGLKAMLKDYPKEALEVFDRALAYPASLAIGRPENPHDEAMIHFWRGVALQQLDRPEEARRAFERCVADATAERALRHGFYGAMNVAHGALALKGLGKNEEFTAQIDRLKTARGSRHWEHEDWLKTYMAFRAAWAQALQGEGPPDAAAFKTLADDPKMPAQWTRLSMLAAQVLRRYPPTTLPAAREASGQ
jgi:tetratricopeptide (TPR) repeat protein